MYAYCMNDPVNMVDPTGQFGIPGAVIGGFTGALGGFLGGIQSGHVWAGGAGGAIGELGGTFRSCRSLVNAVCDILLRSKKFFKEEANLKTDKMKLFYPR